MFHNSKIWVQFLGFVCLAALLADCTVPPALPGRSAGTPSVPQVFAPLLTATPVPTLPIPDTYQEAPSLERLVNAGSLPPVVQRLPETPKVVAPVERIGQYGGAWRMVIHPLGDEAQFIRAVAYEPLLRWTGDGTGIEPNLVERYAFNPKMTDFRFTLRRGVRWSDGQPFTTEDIRFWYEDVLLNPELTRSIPAWLSSGKIAAQFGFVDEYTFTVRFNSPNSLFLERLATPEALEITAFPSHYARKFHVRYADGKSLEQMVAQGKYNSWAEMFIRRLGIHSTDPGNFSDTTRPRLSAWLPQNPYDQAAQSIVWRRNPYYWKVDPQGNQLPYLDEVVFNVVHSVDEIVSRSVAGEIDMQNLDSIGPEIVSAFGSGSQSDRYQFLRLEDGSNNVLVINFNLDHPDPIKRKLFQNQDFRIALSYAINRQEIIDRIFQGQGTPWQSAPRPDSPFYDEVMGSQYTAYNPQKANEFLDRAGYHKDPLGKRLGPDGQPISFILLGVDDNPQQIAILNMVAGYWAQIGIEAHPKVETIPVFLSTVRSNLHDSAATEGGSSFFMDILLDPSSYLSSSENTFWAINWANWYNHVPGFEQNQPPIAARKGLEMYSQIRAVTARADQVRLMKNALLLAREAFWTIGIALGPDRYGIVGRNFINVPDLMPASWIYPDPGPSNPEQFFTEGG